MSDLHKWSDEGATPEENALLQASRIEKPSSSARSRTLTALGVGSIITATTAAAATGSAGVGLGAIAKVVTVVLVVGGIATGGMMWRASHRSGIAISSAPSAVASTAQPEIAPATLATADSSESTHVDLPIEAPRVHSVVRPKPSASAPSLSQEVTALEKAHTALAAHDPDAALRALDRYHSQFPDGALSSEETVLRVQALLARGDTAKAVALANSFSQTHPDSPYARRIQDLVSSKNKP